MNRRLFKSVLVSVLTIALLVTSINIGGMTETKAATLGDTGDYTISASDISSSESKIVLRSMIQTKRHILWEVLQLQTQVLRPHLD